MINLKKILIETLPSLASLDYDERAADAKEFLEILNNDVQVFDVPLYKGTKSHIIETYKKSFIRNDRKPRDTTPFNAYLIDMFGGHNYPEKPIRSSVSFATNRPGLAADFGKIFYVFPSKNCTLWEIRGDSIFYTNASEISSIYRLLAFVRTEIINEKYPIINHLTKIYTDGYHSIMDFLNQNGNYILFEKELVEMQNSDVELLSTVSKDVLGGLNLYWKKLEKLTELTNDYIAEIQMEGDYFYYADENWIDRYFKKDSNNKFILTL